jgi:hypothetical protein
MYGIVYDDFLAHMVSRMDALLQERTEPFAADVEVSNRKSASSRHAVVLNRSPGGGVADTVRTSYVTVDVIADNVGDTTDLMNLTLALATSRGAGGMVDGKPITHAEINGGPNDDEYTADGFFKQTAELELVHRGRNL